MDLLEIIKTIFSAGGLVVLAALFVWWFINDQSKYRKILEDNTDALNSIAESNNNIAKSLEMTTNNYEKLDEKIDRNYQELLRLKK